MHLTHRISTYLGLYTDRVNMRTGVAQSFLESALYKAPDSDSVDHGINGSGIDADSCTCCCRCGRLREWKPNGLKGKRKSRSYSPIRTGVSELSSWLSEPPSQHGSTELKAPCVNAPGEAPIERLPVEVLGKVTLSALPIRPEVLIVIG